MQVRALLRPLTSYAAAGAVLILAMLPGSALARSAGPPPAIAGHLPASTAPSHPTGTVPTRRACSAPTTPREAACEALVRTDATEHQGTLRVGAVPQGFGPADLQSAYKLPSATAGAGRTVAIVDAYDDPYAATDLAKYRAQYGLPPCTVASGCFRKIDQRGGHDYPARDMGWSIEISLDLEMVSAACPKCRILLVESDSAYLNDLGSAVNEAVAQGAKYVSNSYGGGDGFDGEAQMDAQYYTHPGVVLTASGGDNGYPGGFPASSPHVVAVGGTSLTRDPASARGWSETAWADAGSGCDADFDPFFTKPTWQHDSGCSNRTYDDVSAVADPATGLAVYDSYGLPGWLVVGGTSASAPLIASTYALAGVPVDGTSPASYPYAHPGALNDVTSGSNGSCGSEVCTAGPGYDGPTGLGTPRGVSAFAAGPHGTITGTVRDTAGHPVAGATVQVGDAVAYTDSGGKYTASALTGSYTPTAARFGYRTVTGAAVGVTSGAVATENLTLTKLPMVTVTGTVTDASGHGWPLYAQIQVPGTPVVAYTNPATGRYRFKLPADSAGTAYTLLTSAQYPGYLTSSTPVQVGPGGLSQNIGLNVDAFSCTAPGYRAVEHGYSQNFNSGSRPAGWTVNNHGAPASLGWQFGNPGHLPNYTGGTGGFAVADALTPPITGLQSIELDSPVLNLSGDATPVLEFRQDGALNPNQEQALNVNMRVGLSLWGPWTSYQSVAGPNTVLVPLTQAANQSNVQIGFVGDDVAGFSWEIDDVFIGERGCQPVMTSGLIVGQVRDHNTGQPVDGVTVKAAGQQTTTAPQPGDPAVGGGLFWLAAPAGPATVSATGAGYVGASTSASVSTGVVTTANLSLTAGRLAITPGAVSVTEPMGQSRTAKVTISNSGSAPATVSLTAQQGPVTPAAATARTPLRLIPGHYTPGLGKQAARATRTPAATATWTAPWTAAAHYPEAIWDNAAAADPATGDVYSVGGVVSTGNITADVFVYHPAAQTWAQLPSMPFRLDDAVAAVISGKLYVTDGSDGNIQQPALNVYDPRTGLWSPGAPIPHAGYGAAAAVLKGELYVVGGCATEGVCASRQVQVYDPATDAWHQAAPYPRTTAFESCGAIGTKLYCAGGFDHALQSGTSAAYAYNPASNSWSPIASLPISMWGGAGGAAGGRLLVSSGIIRFDSELSNQGYAFDPATNAWSPLPNAPDPVYRGGAACGFYSIGGLDANGPVDSASLLPGFGRCDGGTGPGWLTASPAKLTLAPGQSATVTVKITANVTEPGNYPADLTLNSGVPYAAVQVPVTLTATPTTSWAGLSGVVSGKYCDGTTKPVDAATVQAGEQVATTGLDGRYVFWLPANTSSPTLIATASGWLAATAPASLKPGATTTVNLTLKRASCG